MQNWLKEVYEKHSRLYKDFIWKVERKYLLADFLDALFTVLRNGLAYYWLISAVIKSSITVPEFILYFATIGSFTEWISGILNQLSVLHKESIDLSRLREFLNLNEPFNFEKGVNIPILEKNIIELKNVSFSYTNTKEPILKNINLTISPQEKLAVVGLNGAGKTTLVKLITGLYNPSEGNILLNGVNIKDFNRAEYYKYISAVFQEFSILPSSIEKNITQNVDDITENELKKLTECLELSGLSKKISTLGNGIKTRLCKDIFFDAVELSGGEMQKLLIARALYKDAPFLILDEPTAALDPLAEEEIYNKYNSLAKNKSSLFISHRLASTRFCDRIIFLQDGKIIEEGTHSELLNKGGEYAKLFKIQSKYYK